MLVELLNRLERERDEALMDRNNGDIATMTRNHYERILRECDEARKEAEYYKERYDQFKDDREMSDRPKWYNGREIPDIK